MELVESQVFPVGFVVFGRIKYGYGRLQIFQFF
jgi:hypothetical protein